MKLTQTQANSIKAEIDRHVERLNAIRARADEAARVYGAEAEAEIQAINSLASIIEDEEE